MVALREPNLLSSERLGVYRLLNNESVLKGLRFPDVVEESSNRLKAHEIVNEAFPFNSSLSVLTRRLRFIDDPDFVVSVKERGCF